MITTKWLCVETSWFLHRVERFYAIFELYDDPPLCCLLDEDAEVVAEHAYLDFVLVRDKVLREQVVAKARLEHVERRLDIAALVAVRKEIVAIIPEVLVHVFPDW